MHQQLASNPALARWKFKLKPGGIGALTMTQKNTGAWRYYEFVINDQRYEQPLERRYHTACLGSCHYRPGWLVSPFKLWQAISAAYDAHKYWQGEMRIQFGDDYLYD